MKTSTEIARTQGGKREMSDSEYAAAVREMIAMLPASSGTSNATLTRPFETQPNEPDNEA